MESEKKSNKSTFVVSLTNFLDSSAITAGASGLTLWKEHFNLNSWQIGALGAFSANAFGAAIGALIGGWLADKFGRKFIYQYNMLLYMFGVLIIIFSMNFPMLMAGFLVTGISVGVGVPSSWTYISEASEGVKRAGNIGISQFAWSFGSPVVYLVGAALSPLGLLGNRLLFGFLLVTAFFTWLLQRKLKESSYWEADQKSQSHVQKHKYSELFSNIVSVKSLLFLIGIYMFWNLVAGAMGFFMPYVYQSVGGLDQSQALLVQVATGIITALSTYFLFAKLADRVNQRILFTAGAVFGLIAWFLITSRGMGWTVLSIFVLCWGISSGLSAQHFYSLWSTELFPTKFRAGASGFMFFIVRGSAGVWSLFYAVILTRLGFGYSSILMISFLVISMVVGIIWTPKTRGKSLAQITEERYGKDYSTSKIS